MRLLVLLMAWAPAALPCSTLGPPSLADFAPVADEVVAENVVWLAPAMAPELDTLWSVREVGGSELRPLTVSFDDDFTRLEPPALSAGNGYELVLSFVGDDDGPGPGIAFTVSAADDTVPAAPTIASRTTTPSRPNPLFDLLADCGGREEGTVVQVDVEIDPADDVRGLRFEQVSAAGDSRIKNSQLVTAGVTTASLFDFATADSGVTDYRVIAIDGAGNESEAAVARVDLGCAGACSSSGSVPFVGCGLLLLLRRRFRHT